MLFLEWVEKHENRDTISKVEWIQKQLFHFAEREDETMDAAGLGTGWHR